MWTQASNQPSELVLVSSMLWRLRDEGKGMGLW